MSAERCWFAAVGARPAGAWAAAEARNARGAAASWLAAWRRPGKPVRDAVLADPRAFDPDGAAAWASLVWVACTVRIVFDDTAVQHARRRVLGESSGAVVTTFARDASVFGGALSAWRGPRAPALAVADPFARVHAARVLRVGPGLLATPAALPAPVIERYGGQPWPVDRFPAAGA